MNTKTHGTKRCEMNLFADSVAYTQVVKDAETGELERKLVQFRACGAYLTRDGKCPNAHHHGGSFA